MRTRWDYLRRDSVYTGVFFGHIELERLVHTMLIHENRLCFRSKGLQAVRDFLNARSRCTARSICTRRRGSRIDAERIAERSILDLDEAYPISRR